MIFLIREGQVRVNNAAVSVLSPVRKFLEMTVRSLLQALERISGATVPTGHFAGLELPVGFVTSAANQATAT